MAISKETGEETVHASLIQQSKDEMSFPFPDRPSTFTGNPMMLLDHAVIQLMLRLPKQKLHLRSY